MRSLILTYCFLAIFGLFCWDTFAQEEILYSNNDFRLSHYSPCVNCEVLDYGRTPGGYITRFRVGYHSTVSGYADLTIRFYEQTNALSTGRLLKIFSLSIPCGIGDRFFDYEIPFNEQFDLPVGCFGYSYEFSDPSVGILLSRGGSFNENLIWRHNIYTNNWYTTNFSDMGQPWAVFHFLVWSDNRPYSYGGGDGSEQTPYLIYNSEQMQKLGENPLQWLQHFKLMADIDLSGYIDDTFNVIGNDISVFEGVFDGNGHTISNFTYLSNEGSLGLFGVVSSGGIIKNLRLLNPLVQSSNSENIGAIVGKLDSGILSQCCVVGGSVLGGTNVGALAGYSSGTIENCYARTPVSGGQIVGGLIGFAENATVENSYVAESVTAGSCGGGGLIGGGLGSVVTSSFWDMEMCLPATASFDGNSLPTPDMKSEGTYLAAGWDFANESANGTSDVWDMCDGINYPRFVWEFVSGDVSCPDGVGIEDLQLLAEEWMDGSPVYFDIAPAGGDGKVNLLDFQELSKNWLRE